jgi:cholesterol oxidase
MSGFKFDETMSGWLGIGEKDYEEGRIAGKQKKTPCHFKAEIIIEDLDLFTQLGYGQARLEGTVSFTPLGGTFPMEDGFFNLFSIDPSTGIRQMIYAFRFTAKNGKKYFLYGVKNLKDDPGFDMVEDLTTLFTTIYEGEDDHAPRYAVGQLYFDLKDLPKLLFSMGVPHKRWELWMLPGSWKATGIFSDFALDEIKKTYFRNLSPLYKTEYENLVLSGKVVKTGRK